MDEDISYWPIGLPAPLIGRRLRVNGRNRATMMESRRFRIRRQHLSPIKMMEVSWNFKEDEYDIFRTFFITEIEHGSLSFALETVEHDGDIALMRNVVRDVSFFDSTYTFSASDNFVSVETTLQIHEEQIVLVERTDAPCNAEPCFPPDVLDAPILTFLS